MSEFRIASLDGLQLHGQDWEPAAPARAAVCLIHGLGDHSGRYVHVAASLNRAGYAALAIDLRGHGKSEGKRGHAKNYGVLTDDIYQLVETARKRYPGIPVFLYGHSLGGNLTLYFALKRLPKLAGVVASSPLLRTAERPPAWKISLLKTAYRLYPFLTVSNGLDDTALSRDNRVVQAYQEDPLVHDRVSARLAMDMLRYGRWNMARAGDFPCPLLLMHGSDDRITSARASREFALRVGDLCTFKLWKGCFHELHNEPEKDDVLKCVIDWMSSTVSPAERM